MQAMRALRSWSRLLPPPMLLPPLLLLAVLMFAGGAQGHGRLIEPPSRSSMWRYGFDTPPDYNDHELYCGGFSRQWQRNKGRCGICGDPWDTPQPRAHEAGGQYATGKLVRKYLTGTAITIRIELTANHRGYFEFRLCPVNDFRHDATQDCLDQHVLQREVRAADGEVHETRYYPGPGNKVFASRYRLPAQLTCKHCVLQWRYIAGNNWGICANGTGAVGCGPQEEFRACADVAVVNSAGEADDTPLAPEDTEDEPVDGTPAPKAHDSGSAVLVLLIVLCALAGTATLLSLMYLYFYHAGDRVKSWLAGRWGTRRTKSHRYPRYCRQALRPHRHGIKAEQSSHNHGVLARARLPSEAKPSLLPLLGFQCNVVIF